MNRRAVSQTLPLLFPALALILASCSQHGSSAIAASIPPPITLSGLPAPTSQQIATTTATTEPPTTTTEPPTTTTEVPTTTEAPTTTAAPSTTIPVPSKD